MKDNKPKSKIKKYIIIFFISLFILILTFLSGMIAGGILTAKTMMTPSTMQSIFQQIQ